MEGACFSRDLPFLIVDSSTSSPNKKEKVQSPNPSLVATTIACKHVGCKILSTEFFCVHKALGCKLYWNKGPLKVDLRASTTPVKFDAEGFTMGKDPSCMAR